MVNLKLDDESMAILDGFGFDEIPFEKLSDQLIKDGFDPDGARTDKKIEHLSKEQLTGYPENDTKYFNECFAAGQAAIEAGQVAMVVLNGGMATRFGGVPKGAVEIVNGRTFLDIKISQISAAGKNKTPVVLMNSFATQKATEEHLDSLNLDADVRYFQQFVSMRMTEDAKIFKNDAGKPSFYAPGHGDFPYAINKSGVLKTLMEQGVKYITLSNVDNLGASLDPVVIGMHILEKNPMSVELVKADKGDVGGFPANVEGKSVIMEAFRLPTDFDTDTISVFNTNTFVFDAQILKDTPELSWFAVQKKVEGKTAVQFERLVGQLTEFLEVTWMVVPRVGKQSRFIPIKTVEDITLKQKDLVERLSFLEVL